jgi:hypothetical protein
MLLNMLVCSPFSVFTGRRLSEVAYCYVRFIPRDFFAPLRGDSVPLLRSGFPEAQALHLSIFRQPLEMRLSDSLEGGIFVHLITGYFFANSGPSVQASAIGRINPPFIQAPGSPLFFFTNSSCALPGASQGSPCKLISTPYLNSSWASSFLFLF